jgi:methylisocitrate lyase
MDRAQVLRKLLQEPGIIAAPAVYDCLGAKLAEQAEFPVIFTSGFGIAAATLGLPDLGFLTATEMLRSVRSINQAVEIPVIADIDTGYGNVLNVMRTVQDVIHLGVAGIILEDQEWPKKCGHFEDKRVISTKEQLQKIRAAIEARGDSELVIIARTDARGVYGLEEAIERAKRYYDVGADVIFIEAPQSIEELRFITAHLPKIPLLANLIEGGKTPCLTAQELEKMGYKFVVFALSGLLATVTAVRQYFEILKETGALPDRPDLMQLQAFKDFIKVEQYRAIERRFSKT